MKNHTIAGVGVGIEKVNPMKVLTDSSKDRDCDNKHLKAAKDLSMAHQKAIGRIDKEVEKIIKRGE